MALAFIKLFDFEGESSTCLPPPPPTCSLMWLLNTPRGPALPCIHERTIYPISVYRGLVLPKLYTIHALNLN
jgi:hypothetical protein